MTGVSDSPPRKPPWWEGKTVVWILFELAVLAEIAAVEGDRRRAGTLWGAIEAETARAPVGFWLHGRIEPERVLAHTDAEFERGRAIGRETSFDDAVGLALERPT